MSLTPEIDELSAKMKTLEIKAKARYLDNTEWDYIIEALDEDEQEEYHKLKEAHSSAVTKFYHEIKSKANS